MRVVPKLIQKHRSYLFSGRSCSAAPCTPGGDHSNHVFAELPWVHWHWQAGLLNCPSVPEQLLPCTTGSSTSVYVTKSHLADGCSAATDDRRKCIAHACSSSSLRGWAVCLCPSQHRTVVRVSAPACVHMSSWFPSNAWLCDAQELMFQQVASATSTQHSNEC